LFVTVKSVLLRLIPPQYAHDVKKYENDSSVETNTWTTEYKFSLYSSELEHRINICADFKN